MLKLLTVQLVLSLASAVAIQPADCGVSRGQARTGDFTDPLSRIINGDSVEPNAYPWLVSLRLLTNAHFCAGALVAPNFVLTAGHCIQHLNKHQLFVVAGKANIRETIYPQDIFYVSSIYTHPQYTTFLPNGYDLALLRLNHSVDLSRLIAPICLPSSADEAKRVFDSISVVAGW